MAGDQKAIFDWVKMATTAFLDLALKQGPNGAAFLASDTLVQLSDGKAKLDRR